MKRTISNKIFTCFVIGDDSLLTECTQTLLDKGHEVLGVITSNLNIKSWAIEKGLSLFNNDNNLEKSLNSIHFDYLFSITNLKILSPEIISFPRKGAINFHDGPLPEYAGLNTTSWAIINGEKFHGITWHFITNEIDKGIVNSLLNIVCLGGNTINND